MFGSLSLRIYGGLGLAIVLTVVVAGIVFFSLLGGYRTTLVDNTLQQQANQVLFGVQQFTQRNSSATDLAFYLQDQSEETGTVVFLLDREGTVLADLSPGGEFTDLELPIDLEDVRGSPGEWVRGEVDANGMALPFLARLVPVGFGRTPRQGGFIAVALPDDSTSEIVSDLVPRLLVSGLAGLATALVVGLAISRSIYNPLRQLTAAARAVGGGRYDTRVPASGPQETRALANAFNRMTSEVQANEQTMQDFMADVSHELRTPLTSIRGFTQALGDGTVQDEEQRLRSVQIIDDEARRMLRLVEELLDLSRMQAGEFRLQREPAAPDELVTHVSEVFAQRASDEGLALRTESELGLPAVALDFDRLVQVLGNLVDNAIQHTTEGSVLITAGAAESPAFVRFTVRDTGEGIAAAELEHLFERFYRGSNIARRRGTGLGLAITREIVRAHGGEIRAESTPGSGTLFVIELPVVAPVDSG